MPRIFTREQRSALERACAECGAAAELIGTLTTMGFDMSLKQQENDMVHKAAQTALTADDAFASRTDPEKSGGPVPVADSGGSNGTAGRKSGRKKGPGTS